MTRLFVEGLTEEESVIRPDKKTSHYITRVLRLVEGDEIVAFDGSGREYLCTLVRSEGKLLLRIGDVRLSDHKPRNELVLLQGLLKGQKMDLVARKAAEIGVTTLIPVVTERCQLGRTAKVPRWRTIGKEASRQCGRTDIINVEEVVHFHDLLRRIVPSHEGAEKIVFYERSDATLYSLEPRICAAGRIILFTGPEGGFARHEIRMLSDNGFHIACLGEFILRAETAAIVASGIIRHILERPL